MELLFFFSTDSGILVFFTTDMLSAITLAGPSRGTPIILSLYLSPSVISSTAVFIAINSEPKDDVSILPCFLLYQMIGALLTKIITPVLDLLVTVSPAWSESTNTLRWTGSPRGSGISGGTMSWASL